MLHPPLSCTLDSIPMAPMLAPYTIVGIIYAVSHAFTQSKLQCQFNFPPNLDVVTLLTAYSSDNFLPLCGIAVKPTGLVNIRCSYILTSLYTANTSSTRSNYSYFQRPQFLLFRSVYTPRICSFYRTIAVGASRWFQLLAALLGNFICYPYVDGGEDRAAAARGGT